MRIDFSKDSKFIIFIKRLLCIHYMLIDHSVLTDFRAGIKIREIRKACFYCGKEVYIKKITKIPVEYIY